MFQNDHFPTTSSTTNTRSFLEKIKRKLNEGLNVELSPSSSASSSSSVSIGAEFESTGSSLREAINNGLLSETNRHEQAGPSIMEHQSPAWSHDDEERACSAKYATYNENDE